MPPKTLLHAAAVRANGGDYAWPKASPAEAIHQAVLASERLRPAGPNAARCVNSGPAYGSAFAFAGCLPSRCATAQ